MVALWWHADYPYFFDDLINIRANPILQDWNGIRQIVTTHSRPVAMLSFALNYALSGENVWSYHLFNIFVHAFAGLALYGLIRRTLLLPTPTVVPSSPELCSAENATSKPASGLAFAVALLFVVHPLQTQSVTYMVQRMESLMGLFFLLTLYAVVRGKESARPAYWYLLAIICCWLGMGCKQVMAACPLIVLLYDRIFLATSWREVAGRWWLHLGTFLSLGWLAWLMTLTDGNVLEPTVGFGVGKVSAWEYLCSQGGVILHYLRLVFWPDVLCIDYYWPKATQPLDIYPQCGTVLVLLLGSLWLLWKRPRAGLIAMSFFLILAPTSSFVPIADLAFEHRMYLPLACVLILIVFVMHHWTLRLHLSAPQLSLLRAGLLVIPAILLGGRTMLRNRDYASEMGMWQLVAQQRPDNPRAFKNIAHLHRLAGRRGPMLENYERALQMDPACYLTWINYGDVFFIEQDDGRALQIYRHAAAKSPREYQPWVSIAQLQARRGEMKEALDSCAKARSLLRKPHSRKERKIRAWILSTAEDSALRNGREALALLQSLPPLPGIPDLDLLDRFAAAYAEIGNFTQAVEIQQQVVREAKSRNAPASLQAEYAERLDLYQKKQPYRVRRQTPAAI